MTPSVFTTKAENPIDPKNFTEFLMSNQPHKTPNQPQETPIGSGKVLSKQLGPIEENESEDFGGKNSIPDNGGSRGMDEFGSPGEDGPKGG